MVQGVHWIPIPNSSQLREFFQGGSNNTINRQNEFGNMRDKAAQLFQIEVTQNMLHAHTGDSQVIVSRVNFLNLPSSEILNEDPDLLRAKQGSDLNRGIFSLNNLFRDLSATTQGDYANFDESVLTNLSRDVFGGNSLTVGCFCMQFGDSIGTTMTLRALKRCSSIMNFPVQNDNRVLGLLRKYRVEIQNLSQIVHSSGGNTIGSGGEYSNHRLAELERKLIDSNITQMRGNDEKDRLIVRLGEIKNKFNDMVREKAEL